MRDIGVPDSWKVLLGGYTNTNTKYTCDTGQTRNKLLEQVSEALLAAEKDIAGGGDWTVSSEKLECMMKGKWLNDEV